VSCFVCESYGVKNEPGYGCASYAVHIGACVGVRN